MQRNVDGIPLGGGAGDSGAPTTNAENIDGGPLRGVAGDMGAPTINAKNINGGPRGPCGGSDLHLRSERYVVNLHGHDR
jgi:hypothetical protein